MQIPYCITNITQHLLKQKKYEKKYEKKNGERCHSFKVN
jgi:hypothetical protein